MSSHLPNVIILIGPTASGKTELAIEIAEYFKTHIHNICLLYTSPSPRDDELSRMPSSA